MEEVLKCKKKQSQFVKLSLSEMRLIQGGEEKRPIEHHCVCSCNTAIGTWTQPDCDEYGISFYTPDKCGGDGYATCGRL